MKSLQRRGQEKSNKDSAGLPLYVKMMGRFLLEEDHRSPTIFSVPTLAGFFGALPLSPAWIRQQGLLICVIDPRIEKWSSWAKKVNGGVAGIPGISPLQEPVLMRRTD